MSWSKRAGRGLIGVLILGIFGSVPFAVAGAQTVLSDGKLIEWSHDTYEREDWIYAALYINALIQRNPPQVRNDPVFRQGHVAGLAHAIAQLQTADRLAKAYKDAQNQKSGSNGIASVQSGLTTRPPKVHWPQTPKP